MNSVPDLTVDDGEARALHPRGAWTVANVEMLERLCAGIQPRIAQGIRKIDLSGITALDTVGAWLIEKLARGGPAQTTEAEMTGLSPGYSGLLGEVRKRKMPCCARMAPIMKVDSAMIGTARMPTFSR